MYVEYMAYITVWYFSLLLVGRIVYLLLSL